MSASRAFPWRRNEANTSLKSTRDFPWRRNVATPSASVEQTDLNQSRTKSTLSANASEFVPSCLKDPVVPEQPQTVTAADGNCYLISFDGYSDDDSDDVSAGERSKTTISVVSQTSSSENPAKSTSSTSEEKRPWRRFSSRSNALDIENKSLAPMRRTVSTGTSISVGSTCATPSSSMTQSSSGFSSASSADNLSTSSDLGDAQETDSENLLSAFELLKFRHAVEWTEGMEIHLGAQLVPEHGAKEDSASACNEPTESTSRSSTDCAGIEKSGSDKDKIKASRDDVAKKKLNISEGSWVAFQLARRKSKEVATDEEIARKMKSILNKLTMETFSKLSKQLTSGDITTATHLEILIHEIFEKATTQHHFINMYADLCSMLQAHFAERSASGNPVMNFKRILLGACQASFERHLRRPTSLITLEGEELAAAEQLYKVQMLGNIKFVGALLVRKMLASKVMFAIVEELLGEPTPEALESLAALCTVVGPTFDNLDSAPFALQFKAIFDQIKVFAAKPEVKLRVRCLLKDVLELRASGWHDKKPQKLEGPSTLEQVAQKFHAEAEAVDAARAVPCRRASNHAPSGSDTFEKSNRAPNVARLSSDLFGSSSAKEPTRASIQLKKRKEEANEDRFDREACRKELLGAYTELKASHEMQEAIARVASVAVPASMQSEEVCGLLASIVEESSTEARKVGFKLIAVIFLEGLWKPTALDHGMQKFKNACEDLMLDVPSLPMILQEETCPAFEVLVKRDILPARCLQALAPSA